MAPAAVDGANSISTFAGLLEVSERLKRVAFTTDCDAVIIT